MTTVAEALAQASTLEVEAPEGSGWLWRVRRVSSADLARVQVAALRMVAPAPRPDGDSTPEAELSEVVRQITRMSDRDIEAVSELTGGVIAAGVIAVMAPGRDWEPLDLVVDERKRDVAAGVLSVRDLPAGVDTILYRAIDSLHRDSKGAAERLASFRGAP